MTPETRGVQKQLKPLKRLAMLIVVRDADECSRAIEAALEAMDPPIEVYGGIVRLIAELVPYGGESHELANGSPRAQL